jgi:hypothetical protein
MSARPLIILVAAVVLLSGIVYLTNRPSSRPGTTNDLFAPALADDLDEIMTIRIIGPGEQTVASLTRTADDWVVEERDGYRAATNTIRSALTQLSRASVVEAKTSNPSEYDRLGVEDLAAADAGGIGIEFLPASLNLPGIILGDASGTSYRYARLMNSEQSWLINADPEVPGVTSQWLDAEILNVAGNRVERILIRHADGETVDIFKSAPDQSNYEVGDIPDGRELQYPGVANVIGNVLRNLRLEDVAAMPADPGEPELTTRFETFDGLVVTARGYDVDGTGWLAFTADVDTDFSNPDEAVAAEARSIRERTAGWRYRIPEYQYNQIGRRMQDLLRAEESTD